MSASDIAIFAGQIASLWAVGFAVGYTVTVFKDAASRI